MLLSRADRQYTQPLAPLDQGCDLWPGELFDQTGTSHAASPRRESIAQPRLEERQVAIHLPGGHLVVVGPPLGLLEFGKGRPQLATENAIHEFAVSV